MTVIFIFFVVVLLGAVPSTWLLMLTLGNFGFGYFGFMDCLPAGIILAGLAGSSK